MAGWVGTCALITMYGIGSCCAQLASCLKFLTPEVFKFDGYDCKKHNMSLGPPDDIILPAPSLAGDGQVTSAETRHASSRQAPPHGWLSTFITLALQRCCKASGPRRKASTRTMVKAVSPTGDGCGRLPICTYSQGPLQTKSSVCRSIMLCRQLLPSKVVLA